MSSQQEQDSRFGSMADSTNLIYLVTTAHATCLTVFLREKFGSEALGIPGVCALLLLLITVGLTGSPDLLLFGGCWFIALIVQRSQTLHNHWKGLRLHSRYAGFPAATRLCFPFVSDERVLQRLEPVVASGIGGLLWLCSPAVGQFVLWGAFSLAIKTGLDQFSHHRHLQQLHDAEIEQEVLLADWERQRRSRKGNDSWPM